MHRVGVAWEWRGSGAERITRKFLGMARHVRTSHYAPNSDVPLGTLETQEVDAVSNKDEGSN